MKNLTIKQKKLLVAQKAQDLLKKAQMFIRIRPTNSIFPNLRYRFTFAPKKGVI